MCRALNASANSNKNALVIMDNWGNGTLHGDKVALSTTALTTLGRNSKIFCFAATHNLDVINAVRNVQEISMHQIKVKLLLIELISKINNTFRGVKMIFIDLFRTTVSQSKLHAKILLVLKKNGIKNSSIVLRANDFQNCRKK